eukprot:110312_1
MASTTTDTPKEDTDTNAETVESKEPEIEMEYRMLGGTGLKVSTLSFGFWGTYGLKEGLDRCVSVLRIVRKAGVNFFDNAEAYGKENGDAEIIMGQAIQKLKKEDPKSWRRSDIIISTKIFWGPGKGVNEVGLSRKHVIEGVNGCLERLQLDYVDVISCHRPDPLTSTEEVVRAFTSVIRAGKAFYWGTSEWSAQQITEAYWIAQVKGLIAPVVEQPQYNLFARERVEKKYLALYKQPYALGTTTWSPLNSGVLTGKYNKEVPKDSRFETYKWLQDKWGKEKADKIPKIDKLIAFAKKEFGDDVSVTQLAIAWVIKNKNVSTVLLGATKEHQIKENLKGLALAARLTAKHMEQIDEIMQNKPKKELAWGRTVENKTNPL